MSELDYIYARVEKALAPSMFKRGAKLKSTDDFMRSAAGQRLKAMQAHNAYSTRTAMAQRASDTSTAQRWAAGGRARTAAGNVAVPSRKPPPPRYRRAGGDTGGPGWIGSGNS